MRKCAQSVIICTYALNVEKVWKTLSKKMKYGQNWEMWLRLEKKSLAKIEKKYSLSWEKVTKVEIA